MNAEKKTQAKNINAKKNLFNRFEMEWDLPEMQLCISNFIKKKFLISIH